MGANKYINLQQRQRASKNTENKKTLKLITSRNKQEGSRDKKPEKRGN